jgi:hypothetical protein
MSCWLNSYPTAFFFLTAHTAFIRSDIVLRNAAFFADDVFCFDAARAGERTALVVTGAGAAAAAFAALIAAQRFFVPAIIARLPAALSFRFAGAVGPTVARVFESCSTDGNAAF